REQGAACERRAAQGTLQLGHAQAILIEIVLVPTPRQGLGEATHRIASPMMQGAQRRRQPRVGAAEKRVQALQQIHCTLQQGMTVFLVLERVALLVAVVSAGLVRPRKRLLLVLVPRFLFWSGLLTGDVEAQFLQRLVKRLLIVLPAAPPFLEGA